MATKHTPSDLENNCCQLINTKTNCLIEMLKDSPQNGWNKNDEDRGDNLFNELNVIRISVFVDEVGVGVCGGKNGWG